MSLLSSSFSKRNFVEKEQYIEHLEVLIKTYLPFKQLLDTVASLEEKNSILAEQESVKIAMRRYPHCVRYWKSSDPMHEYVLKVLMLLNQFEHICRRDACLASFDEISDLCQTLVHVENFYQSLGGVLGYYLKVIELLYSSMSPGSDHKNTERYLMPPKIDIRHPSAEINKWIVQGLHALPSLAHMYPVGGAGDRLDLHEEGTGRPLPAARLLFLGRTLLENLIRDLQATEYLYYKIFGKQVVTPILLMTSYEKDNDVEVVAICESQDWFGRPSNSFFRVVQPLIPVISIDGNFSASAPLKLNLKPGGHGVIWKLAEDYGAFRWLEAQGRDTLIVRQINNPIAGLDYGLLTLLGYGKSHNKAFGFASCPRIVHTAEGMNVLLERHASDAFSYCISNIEYTDFERKGISDSPIAPNSTISNYPANTNILFVDIASINSAIKTHPLPGLIVNAKTPVHSFDESGQKLPMVGARLESTMQNIADGIVDTFTSALQEPYPPLKTFLMYNDRHKTISTTKRSFDPLKSILETPEGCFYDLMGSHCELLKQYCQIQVPELNSIDEYIKKGPNILFHYHPSLGPVYSIIQQKLHKGHFQEYAEVQLEISELFAQHLHVNGSLIIKADYPLGQIKEETRTIQYSNHVGRCWLKNVIIDNLGIDRSKTKEYWKLAIARKEALSIHLLGHSEFCAEDVVFKGNYTIVVPDKTRAIAKNTADGRVEIIIEPLNSPSWYWRYHIGKNEQVILKLERSANH